jgi:hypothetical protein
METWKDYLNQINLPGFAALYGPLSCNRFFLGVHGSGERQRLLILKTHALCMMPYVKLFDFCRL